MILPTNVYNLQLLFGSAQASLLYFQIINLVNQPSPLQTTVYIYTTILYRIAFKNSFSSFHSITNSNLFCLGRVVFLKRSKAEIYCCCYYYYQNFHFHMLNPFLLLHNQIKSLFIN